MDLLPLPWGPPRVPEDVVASISHKEDLALALVTARATPCGVDLEKIDERDAVLVNRIMTPREQASGVSPVMATLHFSAKEAVYKSMSAEVQLSTDFEDIELAYGNEDNGWLELAGLVGGSLKVCVRALVGDQWILTIATRS